MLRIVFDLQFAFSVLFLQTELSLPFLGETFMHLRRFRFVEVFTHIAFNLLSDLDIVGRVYGYLPRCTIFYEWPYVFQALALPPAKIGPRLIEFHKLNLNLIYLSVLNLGPEMVFLFLLGELVEGEFLSGPSDGATLYPFRPGMHLLPIGQYFYDEFNDACVFADVWRRGLFEGNLHNDANDVLYLLDFYLVQRAPLQNVNVVNQTLLYDVEALLYRPYRSRRVELFHDPA